MKPESKTVFKYALEWKKQWTEFYPWIYLGYLHI